MVTRGKLDDVATILIVEDDADLRQLFRTTLALEGYRVLEARDGVQALHFLRAILPIS
jgi:DNA-binding response OmpR family regulator